MFQQPGFETASLCFISMPRRFSQAVTCVCCVNDSMGSRSSWKRQWTWPGKLHDVLEIFSVSRIDYRMVHTKLETAVTVYLKCTLCTVVVTGNRRICWSRASQTLITTHASVLQCLSVSLLLLRVQTHWNRTNQTSVTVRSWVPASQRCHGQARQVLSGFGAWRVLRHSLSIRTAVEQEIAITPQSRVLLKKLIVSQPVKSPHFIESKSWSLRLREPANCPCPRQQETTLVNATFKKRKYEIKLSSAYCRTPFTSRSLVSPTSTCLET